MVLLRPEGSKEDFHLPAGATLGDLLRAANINRDTQAILIDGKSVEDLVALQPGMIVTIVPKPKPALDERWRETIGMFHGNEAMRELIEAVEKSREAEKDRS